MQPQDMAFAQTAADSRAALRLNRPARAPLGSTLRGFTQKNHLEDLVEIVPDARTIFDVGANAGETAEQFWSFFQQATVYCFEPAPKTFQFLQSRAGKVPRLVLENRAVSDKVGRLTLHQYGDPAANSLLPADPRAFAQIPNGIEETGTTEVDVVTLDGYCETHGIQSIDILKFDIQGHELRALEGAERLLASRKIGAIYTEVLFIPVYTGQGEFHEIQALLQGYGYELFDFYGFSYGANGQLRWGDALFLPAS